MQIDHIGILIDSNNDHFVQSNLVEYKQTFIELLKQDNDDYYIYKAIKLHSEFINYLVCIKDKLINDFYPITHIINEGICGYRILLLIEQNLEQIQIIELIRIQELVLILLIDHLHYIIGNGLKLKSNTYSSRLNKLKAKQAQEYIRFSLDSNLKGIISVNNKIYDTAFKLSNEYQKLEKSIINNHIINEEHYYINLILRIKKSFSSH